MQTPPTTPVHRELIDDGPVMLHDKARVMIPLLGCGVFGVVFLLVSGTAILNDMTRSKTSEATMNMRKIFDASVTYYGVHQRFPDAQARTPAEPVGEWPMPQEYFTDSATWQALNFRPHDRFLFQYQYDATNHPTDPSRSTFTASAFGDLDADGVLSTFVRFGSVDEMGVTGSGGLYIANELE